MRLVDRGGDFFLGIFARELDQVGALAELDPHRLAPLLGTDAMRTMALGLPLGTSGSPRHRVQRPVAAGAGDQLPAVKFRGPWISPDACNRLSTNGASPWEATSRTLVTPDCKWMAMRRKPRMTDSAPLVLPVE